MPYVCTNCGNKTSFYRITKREITQTGWEEYKSFVNEYDDEIDTEHIQEEYRDSEFGDIISQEDIVCNECELLDKGPVSIPEVVWDLWEEYKPLHEQIESIRTALKGITKEENDYETILKKTIYGDTQ